MLHPIEIKVKQQLNYNKLKKKKNYLVGGEGVKKNIVLFAIKTNSKLQPKLWTIQRKRKDKSTEIW